MHIIVRSISFVFLLVSITYTAERRIRYISVERPQIHFNSKYFNFMNMSARRFGRQNPLYYVDIHFDSLIYFGNNVSMDYLFYKELSNGNRFLMMEISYNFCDLLIKDRFIGASMRQGKLMGTCPYKPGAYHVYNMTIPFDVIPPNFPLVKGKIFINITKVGTKEFLASGSMEMDVKEMKVKIS